MAGRVAFIARVPERTYRAERVSPGARAADQHTADNPCGPQRPGTLAGTRVRERDPDDPKPGAAGAVLSAVTGAVRIVDACSGARISRAGFPAFVTRADAVFDVAHHPQRRCRHRQSASTNH